MTLNKLTRNLGSLPRTQMCLFFLLAKSDIHFWDSERILILKVVRTGYIFRTPYVILWHVPALRYHIVSTDSTALARTHPLIWKLSLAPTGTSQSSTASVGATLDGLPPAFATYARWRNRYRLKRHVQARDQEKHSGVFHMTSRSKGLPGIVVVHV